MSNPHVENAYDEMEYDDLPMAYENEKIFLAEETERIARAKQDNDEVVALIRAGLISNDTD